MSAWAAFVIGILGSLHCIGMCGPLAAALPPGPAGRGRYVAGRVIYNTGRIITYMGLGAIGGLLGQSVAFMGFQRGFSIAIGLVLLGLALFGARFSARLAAGLRLPAAIAALKAALGDWLRRNSTQGLFVVGLLNGLLPCGLVYVALAAAATAGSAPAGMLAMLFFGLGTLPAMLAASLVGAVVMRKLRLPMHRLIPIGLAALAALFIWRGAVGSAHCRNMAPGEAPHSCCAAPGGASAGH